MGATRNQLEERAYLIGYRVGRGLTSLPEHLPGVGSRRQWYLEAQYNRGIWDGKEAVKVKDMWLEMLELEAGLKLKITERLDYHGKSARSHAISRHDEDAPTPR